MDAQRTETRLTVIVPAHNETDLVGDTVGSVRSFCNIFSLCHFKGVHDQL